MAAESATAAERAGAWSPKAGPAGRRRHGLNCCNNTRRRRHRRGAHCNAARAASAPPPTSGGGVSSSTVPSSTAPLSSIAGVAARLGRKTCRWQPAGSFLDSAPSLRRARLSRHWPSRRGALDKRQASPLTQPPQCTGDLSYMQDLQPASSDASGRRRRGSAGMGSRLQRWANASSAVWSPQLRPG